MPTFFIDKGLSIWFLKLWYKYILTIFYFSGEEVARKEVYNDWVFLNRFSLTY